MNKKIKRILLIYISLLSIAAAVAQNPTIDSLKKKLATGKEDTGRVNTLIQLGKAGYADRDYELTGHYGQLALALSQKLKYKKGEAAASGLVGRYHYKNNRDTAALRYFNPALKINLELDDFNEAGQSYIDIAGPYYQQGNYPEALKYSYLSLKMYEQAENTKMTGYVWMRIGLIQYYLKNHNESLVAFENALGFAKLVEDRKSEAFAIKNIGVIYFVQAEAACANGDTLVTLKKCEASIANYQAALKIYEKLGDGYGVMETYHPLGNTYEKMAAIARSRNNDREAAKNTALAQENFSAFLRGAEKFNDRNYISEANYALGSLFLKQKKIQEAEKHLKKGLQISIDIAMNGNIKIGYCHLAELYSSAGDYKQAFSFHKLCADYNDSLVNDENKQKALQMQMNYEVGKKEDQLKLLSAENKLKTVQAQKESQQKKLAYAGIAALLLLGGYGFYRYTRKKSLQNKQAMTNERLRISSDLHDEVGATLSGISMYSHLIKGQLQSNNVSGVESSLQVMQQSSSQMVDKLNDIVWFINPEKDTLQQLISRLEDYAIKMAAIKDIKVNIKVPDEISKSVMNAETRRNIYLFCKEAINNAVKYSNATTLDFSVAETNNMLQITVADNGVGFDVMQATNGNGLASMKKRATAINGQMQLESANGAGAIIKLSIKITQ